MQAKSTKVTCPCSACGTMVQRFPSQVAASGRVYCSRGCSECSRAVPSAVRFAKYVLIGTADACWEWQAGRSPRGYGRLRVGSRHVFTHRFAYELAHGEGSAEGWQVNHGCHNPPCCNPAHLMLGDLDNRDNLDDCIAAGRTARGDRSPSRLYPERRPRGDRNGARLHPERLARGDRSGARLHPERWRRGEQHFSARFTEDQVRAIRVALAAGIEAATLARQYQVSKTAIRSIKYGKTWKHVA